MARSKSTQEALRPIYVAPVFTRREREAMRQWSLVRFTGRPLAAPGQFDPLALRAGLRAHAVLSRAGWVVSNPILDGVLRRNPALDESLPGSGWLRCVYVRERALVALPGVRAVVDSRMEALRAYSVGRAPTVVAEPQADLFAAEAS